MVESPWTMEMRTYEPATLSVLMAVHNGGPWLAEAVHSLLHQTMAAFECVVVDDGSTDETPNILAELHDPRFLVVHQPRRGLTPSLTHALRLTRAPFIGRMDADDVALPERFARQLAFLGGHSEVGLLGTGGYEVTQDGQVIRTLRPPTEDQALRLALPRANPFLHSSIVMRREAVEAVGGYDEGFPVAQDYDLWARMAQITKLANLPEPLILRRMHPRQLSGRSWPRRVAQLRIQSRMLFTDP